MAAATGRRPQSLPGAAGERRAVRGTAGAARAVSRSAAIAVSLSLAACAGPQLRQLNPQPAAIELEQTPFFPQELHHCGPAALATVLTASGVDTTPEILAPQIYLPEREGSMPLELLAATRRAGRVPVTLAPRTQSILEALRDGRPVLVLQNLRLTSWPRWHYAVVIGYDAADNALILRSGRKRRVETGLRRFLNTWERAQRWAIVAARPDDPPSGVRPRDWIAAAAPFESRGQVEIARTAYESAVQRWPDEPLAWQALGNARYAAKDLPGAEAALRKALELSPEAATRNNLAQILLDRGCAGAARAQLDAIEAVPPALAATVSATREEVLRAGSLNSGSHCGP